MLRVFSGGGGGPFRTAGFEKNLKLLCLFLGCTFYKSELKSLSVTVFNKTTFLEVVIGHITIVLTNSV